MNVSPDASVVYLRPSWNTELLLDASGLNVTFVGVLPLLLLLLLEEDEDALGRGAGGAGAGCGGGGDAWPLHFAHPHGAGAQHPQLGGYGGNGGYGGKGGNGGNGGYGGDGAAVLHAGSP